MTEHRTPDGREPLSEEQLTALLNRGKMIVNDDLTVTIQMAYRDYAPLIEYLRWLEADRTTLEAECARLRGEVERLAELLGKSLPLVEMEAESQSYGGALVDDPRDFTPDPECSTEEERAVWHKACEDAEAQRPFKVPKHEWESFDNAEEADTRAKQAITEGADTASVHPKKDGTFVVHIANNGWGLGTSTIRNPELIDLRDAIRAALAQRTPGSEEKGR